MELPDNWDKVESAYNKHYDPYDDDEDGSVSELVHCPNCDSYIHIDERLRCVTCEYDYCEWCASDRKGGHVDVKCRILKGDQIEIPF